MGLSAHFIASMSCVISVSRRETRSRSATISSERSRSFLTKGSQNCSVNLTKLMNAERIYNVRSRSGDWISLEQKSSTRDAVARRVLRNFNMTAVKSRFWMHVQMVEQDVAG
jgi:hypothetical protein